MKAITGTERVFSWLSRAQHWLTGKRQLRPYEQMCLDAWRESLADKDRAILDQQLAAVNLIQRQAGDAKVCFFYPAGQRGAQTEAPLFANREPDLHVADVTLASKDATNERMRAKVFVHNGRFFSIEFPKRPDRYMQLHGMKEATLQVAGVSTLESL